VELGVHRQSDAYPCGHGNSTPVFREEQLCLPAWESGVFSSMGSNCAAPQSRRDPLWLGLLKSKKYIWKCNLIINKIGIETY